MSTTAADQSIDILVRLLGMPEVRQALKGMRAEVTSSAAAASSAGKTHGAGFAQALRGAESAAGSLTKRLVRLGAAYLSVRSAISSVFAALRVGGDFERLRTQLDGLMGSAAGGERAFAWVRDFAAQTPFQVQGVTDAFLKLKAFGLDPMDGTMQAIADQSARLGGGQETLQGIILAVGQAWAKQRLQGEEIMQLVERGVPVWDLLAQATGRNSEELQKLSASGQLGRDVIRLLVEEMGKATAGSAQAQMQTWDGLVSNMKDTWSEFLNTIAQSGALDYFKAQLSDLLATAKEMASTGQLKAWAEDASQFITGTAEAVRVAVTTLASMKDELLLVAKVWAGYKALSIAAKFSAWSQGALLAASSVGKLSAAVRVLNGLLKASVFVFAAEQLVRLGLAIREYYATLDGIEARKQKYLAAQSEIAASHAQFAQQVLKSRSEMEQMTAAELRDYSKRIAGAREYYRAKRDLQSRQDFDPNDPTKAVSQEALAYARQERVYREHLNNITDLVRQRTGAEVDFGARVAEAKKAETEAIRSELAKQIKAYEDANDRIKSAQQRRRDIEKEFKAARDNIGKPETATENLTTIDFAAVITDARSAFSGGDLDSAIQKAREAKNLVMQMAEGGKYTDLVLRGLIDQAAEVATVAAKAQEEQATADASATQQQIQKLLADAEFLKQIEIGFDTQGAQQSAEELRAQLQAKLKENPLVLPVVVQSRESDQYSSQVDNLFDQIPGLAVGGPIIGPGSDTSDSIIARLSRGEWVIRAAAVRHYGHDLFRRINSLNLPGFATGGLVPAIPKFVDINATSRADRVTSRDVVDVNLVAPTGNSYRMHSSREVVQQFVNDLAALRRGRS